MGAVVGWRGGHFNEARSRLVNQISATFVVVDDDPGKPRLGAKRRGKSGESSDGIPGLPAVLSPSLFTAAARSFPITRVPPSDKTERRPGDALTIAARPPF